MGNAVTINSETDSEKLEARIAPTQTFSKILASRYFKMIDSEKLKTDILITNPEPEILDLLRYD